MILAKLIMQDYKQFAGSHEFIPPKAGVIGVVGENGTGKSTLFEAIEWVLYQPREIRAADIFPRVVGGSPKVSVELLDEYTGRRWVIERWVNRAGLADARAVTGTGADEIVVTGSKAVTAFVHKVLIGLGHKAFVSTFYTRQKELSFFGMMGETERRREVGKLLGLETIREAQKAVGEERSAAQGMARMAEAQYDQELAERDFQAEIAMAIEAQERAQAMSELAELEAKAAESTWEQARDTVAKFGAKQQEHLALEEEVRAAGVKQSHAKDTVDRVTAELAKLDTWQARIPLHQAHVNKIPGLREQIAVHEANVAKRTKFESATERLVAAEKLQVSLTTACYARYEEDVRRTTARTAKLLQQVGEMPVRPEGDFCPTCGQPIETAEADRLHNNAVAEWESKLATAKYEAQEETKRLARFKEIADMLANDKQHKVHAGIQEAAQSEEPVLIAVSKDLAQCLVSQETARQDCIEFSAPPADTIALAELRNQLTECATAERSLEMIAKLAEARPGHELELENAKAQLAATAKVINVGNKMIADLGYDAQAHATAHTLERQSIAEYKAANLKQVGASRLIAEAQQTVDKAKAELARVEELLATSERMSKAAAVMDLMYRELSQFEQFVGERIVPELASYTSDIVAAVTQGKYDRVEFSGSYAIEVHDGEGGAYPLAEFSGGERDVVSLAARMALSRLIGRQAVSPPGFMVLDEVFGSLDRDRRERTLEMLDSMVGHEAAFKQLFVISHVDDVQAHRVFDAVWQASEGDDGVSRLECIGTV